MVYASQGNQGMSGKTNHVREICKMSGKFFVTTSRVFNADSRFLHKNKVTAKYSFNPVKSKKILANARFHFQSIHFEKFYHCKI